MLRKVSVRGALMQFQSLPDVSIGGFIEEYFEVMGSSHFCLVPEGTSSWTCFGAYFHVEASILAEFY